MSDLHVGDTVAVIDESIHGTVTGIAQGLATIRVDGFEFEYPISDLVKIDIAENIGVSNYEIAQAKKDKDLEQKKQRPAKRAKKKEVPAMEVDLHIGQLVASTKRMTNHDILSLQLDTAKRRLEFAIQKRISRVVFIHGVGEGVLKEELKFLLRRYDQVSFYDANYQKYGQGATEVYIRQSS